MTYLRPLEHALCADSRCERFAAYGPNASQRTTTQYEIRLAEDGEPHTAAGTLLFTNDVDDRFGTRIQTRALRRRSSTFLASVNGCERKYGQHSAGSTSHYAAFHSALRCEHNKSSAQCPSYRSRRRAANLRAQRARLLRAFSSARVAHGHAHACSENSA
jgi:hypothetical protein